MVIGDLIQSWHEVLVRIWAPPYLANIRCIISLYNLPSLPFVIDKLFSIATDVCIFLVRMLLCRT